MNNRFKKDGKSMIKTKYYGEIEIDGKDIIYFKKGIPGFPDDKKFVILPLADDGVFSIMQSVTTEYVAFVVTNPFQFFKDYEFQLEDLILEELELATEKEVMVFSILTIGDPFDTTTANLQAPVVINIVNKKAKQVILNNSSYQVKHSIFQKG